MGLSDWGAGLLSSAKKSGSRPPLEGIYIYLLAVIAGYWVADLSVLYVRPQMLPTKAPPLRQSRPADTGRLSRNNYTNISKRNIFDPEGKIPPPLSAGQGEQLDFDDGPAVLSQLPLKLEGTIVHVNSRKSVATIMVRNKNESKPFMIEDEIEGLAKLTRIERRKVTFRNLNNNRLEYIEIPKDSKINLSFKMDKPSSGDVVKTGRFDFQVKRADIVKYTSNLSSILNQARMVPNIIPGSGGRVEGFRFVSIQPDSIYEKLGFKPMDIIKAVNGEPVNSPTKAMELYNALKVENRIGLTIERGGRDEEFRYEVSD